MKGCHFMFSRKLLGFLGSFLAASAGLTAAEKVYPDPAIDMPAATGEQVAVFAGGCFWGIEGVYEHVKGVKQAVSGYSGGEKATAHYEMVSEGNTGHAESVYVVFDPAQITYGQLLKIFFAVAHDPTEKDHQGPDWGSQYRSVIFYANEDQKRVAEAYIKQLEDAKIFSHRIVTQVVSLKAFYPAEAHHQHFMENNPMYPYIVYNDLPKLNALKKHYPELCKR
jgi:peptide-methionine (S)-S-oxide reductase